MAAWRPWSISGEMDGAAMDSASERGCESGWESDSSMPGLVSDNESPSDSSADDDENARESAGDPTVEQRWSRCALNVPSY